MMYEATFWATTKHNTSCTDNKIYINMISFKSSENIKQYGWARQILVTLNELAMNAGYLSFYKAVKEKLDIIEIPKGNRITKICFEYMTNPILFSDF